MILDGCYEIHQLQVYPKYHIIFYTRHHQHNSSFVVRFPFVWIKLHQIFVMRFHFSLFKRNVIIMLFFQLIKICNFEEYSNLNYHHLMRKDVIEMKLKVYLGIEKLRKIHWPTFMSTFSSKRKWEILAELTLVLVIFFRPQDLGSSSI